MANKVIQINIRGTSMSLKKEISRMTTRFLNPVRLFSTDTQLFENQGNFVICKSGQSIVALSVYY